MICQINDVRDVMRAQHYSYETEKVYIYWIRQYIGNAEVEGY